MKKILILDDDPDFRNLLHMYVTKAFPEAEVVLHDPVLSGVPGDDYDWSDTDILLLDHFLCIEGCTGLDILRAHHEKPEFPATLMLTAATDEEIALKALNFGAYDFIRKQELRKEALIERIESAYSRYQVDLEKRLALHQRKQAFSKSNFYKNLKRVEPLADKATTRVLTLLFFSPVSSGKDIQEQILLRDQVVKYAASISYTFFSRRDIQPNITLMSDRCVSVLFDSAEGINALEERLLKFNQFHINNCCDENTNLSEYIFSTAALFYSPALVSADAALERLKHILDQAENNDRFYTETLLTEKDLQNIASVEAEATSTSVEPVESTQTQKEDSVSTTESSVQQSEFADADDSKSKEESIFSLEDFDLGLVVRANRDNENLGTIVKGFEEKRFVQNYQNIISFADDGDNSEMTFYTSCYLIDDQGNEQTVNELFNEETQTELLQYLDRWMLKELAGSVVQNNLSDLNHQFILRLSNASFADLKLFDWLRQLLTGLAPDVVGRHIILEVNQADYAEYEKQCLALVSYLRKNHQFRVAFSGVTDVDALQTQLKSLKPNYLISDQKGLQTLAEQHVDSTSEMNYQQWLSNQRIACICTGINQSMQLMQAIASGANFAMGSFVGEPSSELSSLVTIETMELETERF